MSEAVIEMRRKLRAVLGQMTSGSAEEGVIVPDYEADYEVKP